MRAEDELRTGLDGVSSGCRVHYRPDADDGVGVLERTVDGRDLVRTPLGVGGQLQGADPAVVDGTRHVDHLVFRNVAQDGRDAAVDECRSDFLFACHRSLSTGRREKRSHKRHSSGS